MPPVTNTNPYPRGVAFPVGTEAEITNIPIDGELRLFIPQGESFACKVIRVLMVHTQVMLILL